MKTQNKLNQENKFRLQKMFLVLLLLLTGLLLVFRLAKANSYVDDSNTLSDMEKKLVVLDKENEDLTQYVQGKSSLSGIKAEAEKRGMVGTQIYTYLPTPANMALESSFRLQ